MKFLRLLATWLLMLTLPLQAMAAYVPLAKCDDGRSAAVQPHESHAEHRTAGDADHHTHAGGGHGPDEGAAGDFNGHSCCHHVFPAVAASLLPLTPQAPNAVTPRIALLNTLFIPELPQRPPRA